MRLYTSNPVFNSFFWRKKEYGTDKMTLFGVIVKTLFSLFLVSSSIWYVWTISAKGKEVSWYLYGGMIVAVIVSVITSYKQKWAPITVPVYAIAKGYFLGAITVFASRRYPELPLKAIFYTIVTFVVVLFLYKMRIIQVTKKFRSIIYSAIATIFTIYFIGFIFRLFGVSFSFLYSSSWISIAFSVIIITVASFSLLLDFDYIERYLYKAPKYKEWVATWGLLVTLIWMYLEILRLLKKITNRF